jgi:sulfur carrier protein ThiS
MTDFGIEFRSSDDFFHLRDRVAAARAQTRANAERYVELRRRVDATCEVSREIGAQVEELRDSLRDSVMTYAAVLRRNDVPPERAIVLVKSVVVESDSYPDKHHRHVVEESVRWAVDAYYAA